MTVTDKRQVNKRVVQQQGKLFGKGGVGGEKSHPRLGNVGGEGGGQVWAT